jgi:hypothetical protein
MLTPRDFGEIVAQKLTAENWAVIVETAIRDAAAGDKDARDWLCNWSNVTGCSHSHELDDDEPDICAECGCPIDDHEDDDDEPDNPLKHGYHSDN